ncbi:LytS/YhcK type 5TM receptor domain-containing protein [Natroniella sp. ANB-PHB2]|uniref:LytS/YhcK type 5TM receptor domain-containing protein n=1 Tax=Natroniella sp. ANB-PHB2 TaxID=3384444 RepID=UPI0038D4C3AC
MQLDHIGQLLFALIKSVSVIAVFAYLLVFRGNIFIQLINRRTRLKTKLFLGVFFGFFSILGTYVSVITFDAYTHIRIIGPVVAGFLAGPFVGGIAGLFGGIHRYFLGGYTALAAAISVVLAGLVGGVIYYSRPFNKITLLEGFIIGVVHMVIEMKLILLLSSPYEQALEFVKVASLPMILSNALGIVIFISILKDCLKKQEDLKALQSHKSLKIANQSLSYLQSGLNYDSALAVAQIILDVTDVKAVCITDDEKVLAHCGIGEDHHKAGSKFLTEVTEEVLEKGCLSLISHKERLGCPVEDCDLMSAVIAPLKKKDKVVGSLKLYKTDNDDISSLDIELARGISNLLSTQLHISSLEEEAKLTTEAELKALQAQIHPHFLFNALNTVISFCRTEPTKARNLLIKLSKFFRRTLNQESKFISLKEEIEKVLDYIAIEKARFSSKFEFEVEVEDELLDYQLPIFTLQPLVENAIKHGISHKVGSGTVKIEAFKKDDIIIRIIDDGVGISEENLVNLLNLDSGRSCGIGLNNVDQRIKKIYGSSYGLKINSEVNLGTTVEVKLPVEERED